MAWLTDDTLVSKIVNNASDETLLAFQGVFPMDKLPDSVSQLPFLMIVNTHAHNLPGEHWLAIFIDRNRRGEIFDSLAMPVSILLARWMNRFTQSWQRNRSSFQNPLSASCGAFVLYYVLNRTAVSRLNEITKAFSSVVHENEHVVRSFYVNLK
ncbi:MAG: hypothetical protein AAGJ80_17880 [Cyanobacteria bacterium J06553_1]